MHARYYSLLRALAAALPVAFLAILPAEGQSVRTQHTLSLDDPAAAPKARIADVAWMAGTWTAPAFGGTAQEVWAPPLGDSMVGSYKIVRDGETTMYELFALVEDEGSLTIRLKHFNADLSGWEDVAEYVSFPLVRLEATAAYFDGLTYRLTEDGTLLTHLALTRDGQDEEVEFRYRPAGHERGAREAGAPSNPNP